ncbi:MAG: sigma-70 family RNA polymerase sigma factor [Candidatus Poribacteria bacterium]|nr:sigma-70 family RNA polymerase sigma factor [Candidatus Poribacteria bacterium]
MERDDVELINSILAGDEAAFSTLVKKYQKSVHALAWRKIGDFHIAEEITQDVFLQAHKKLASLKNPSQFAGWLYVIADRLCKAWFRKKQLKKRLDMQSLEATSEETLEKTDYAHYTAEQREKEAVEHQRQIVQRLMEKLPESERTVMVLYYLGEMSCEEIGRFLGVSPNTVKSRLRRARESLKNQEHIISETLSGIQLPANLTENIMEQIAKLKEVSPQGGNRLPWTTFASSAVLAFLLIGAGTQLLMRFQQPYSLEAKSETVIEIVDAPIVLDIQSKSDLQNRIGNHTIPGKNSNDGLSTGTKTMENTLTQDTTQWNLPEDAKARFGKGYPFDFEYSLDGTKLAVGSTIGIWIYDARTGEELDMLTGHTYYVNRAVFSPDGKTFASMSRWNDEVIRLWSGATGELKSTLIGHTAIVFSPDSKTLASASDNHTVRLWDGATGDLKATLTGHTGNVKVLAFSPDGHRLASGGTDEVIRLWHVAAGELLLTFAAHANSVDALIYSPNGEQIASQGGDGNVCLWNAQTGEFLHLLSDHTKEVASMDFSKDNETLATAHYDGTIQLWNTHTGEHLKTINAGTELYSVSYSPDGSTYVCNDDDGKILLYDANTDELLHAFKLPSGSVGDMKYSRDGQILVGSDQFGLHFWDTDTGELLQTITGYSEVIDSVVYSPDGHTLVSLAGVLRFWDVETEKLVQTLVPESSVASIAYSPDGQTLACGTRDNTILLWNVSRWKQVTTLEGHAEGISSVVFSPDGQILASGSWDHTIRLWNPHTGEPLKTLTGHSSSIKTVAFSRNGGTLASGGDNGTIRFWNIDTGELLNTIETEADTIDSVVYSPDGKTLASTGNNGDHGIRFWDVDTGELLKTVTVEKGAYSVVYSPDGRTFASGGSGEVSVWDVATGERLKTFTGHIADPVYSVAYSPNGRTLASGCRDSTIILWDLTQ